MTLELVFPEPETERHRPLGQAEPEVNFYRESTREQAIVARKWINEAYSNFPDVDRRLATRLRSADNVQHQSAMDELYVHAQLFSRGEVRHEEGGRGPDFRLYRDAEYVGGVEVCSLFGNAEWDAKQQQHGRIADELNRRMRLGSWFIHFEIVRLDGNPPIKPIVSWMNAQITTLGRPDAGMIRMTDPLVYRAKEVTLSVSFVPRISDSPPKPADRIVGTGALIGGFVDSAQRLRSALEKKVQKRYDMRGKPFSVFVGIWDTMSDIDDNLDALYGDEVYFVNTEELTRARNGFFGIDRRRPVGKHRDLSTVFIRHRWTPWSTAGSVTVRFDNPFGLLDFPSDVLDHQRHFCAFRDEKKVWMDWR